MLHQGKLIAHSSKENKTKHDDDKEDYLSAIKNEEALVIKNFNLLRGYASYNMSHLKNFDSADELIEKQNAIEEVIKYNNDHVKKLTALLKQMNTIQCSCSLITQQKIQKIKNNNTNHAKNYTERINKKSNNFIKNNLSIQKNILQEINKTKLELNKLEKNLSLNMQHKATFEFRHLQSGRYEQVRFTQFSIILKHVSNTKIFDDFSKYGNKNDSCKTKQIEKYIHDIKNAENLDKLFEAIQSNPVIQGVRFSMRENTKKYGGWYSFLYNGLQSTSDNYAVAIQTDLINFLEKKYSIIVPEKYKIRPPVKEQIFFKV